MHLQISLQCLLAGAAGCTASGVEPTGQVGDRLLEALRDGREVLLVPADQCRVGLGGEVVGKVEGTAQHTGHTISSSPWHVATDRDCAVRPGFCGLQLKV